MEVIINFLEFYDFLYNFFLLSAKEILVERNVSYMYSVYYRDSYT